LSRRLVKTVPRNVVSATKQGTQVKTAPQDAPPHKRVNSSTQITAPFRLALLLFKPC